MLSKIKQSPFIKNTLTLMSGTLLAQIFSLLSYPILTYLYQPSEFGLLGTFSAILAIVVVIVNGGYETTIMLPDNFNTSKQLFSLCLILTSISSILSLIIVIIINIFVYKYLPFEFNEIKIWLYLLPLSVFFEGSYVAMSTFLNRQKKYKILTQTKISQALTNSIVCIITGYFFSSFTGGLIIGLISGQFVAFIIAFNNTFKKEIIHETTFETLYKHAIEYIDFPKYSIGASYLNSISRQLPFFLIPIYFTDKNILGYFTLAYKILTAPLTFIGTTISQIFFEKIARLNDKDENLVKKLSLKLILYIGLLSLIPTISIIWAGEDIFSLIFGKNYSIAGTYSRWIMPWIAITYLVTPLSSIINIHRKLKFDLIYNTLFLVARALAIIFGGLYLDATKTIALFCSVSLAFNLFLLLWLISLSGKIKYEN